MTNIHEAITRTAFFARQAISTGTTESQRIIALIREHSALAFAYKWFSELELAKSPFFEGAIGAPDQDVIDMYLTTWQEEEKRISRPYLAQLRSNGYHGILISFNNIDIKGDPIKYPLGECKDHNKILAVDLTPFDYIPSISVSGSGSISKNKQ